MRFFIAELAAQLNGRVLGDTARDGAGGETPVDADSVSLVDGLAIDSRLVISGQLFAAVRAERDGHEFVDAAFTAQQAQLGLWGACHG